jgi:hypothetical protein
MDWRIETTDVVILGAGFSLAATNGRAPLMRGFFDQLERVSFPLLYEFVEWEAGKPVDANVEAVLLALDQIRTAPESALGDWAGRWKVEASAIERQLAEYSLARLRPCLEIPDDSWPAYLLAETSPRTTVVSMNYDNVAERILSNRKGITHRRAEPSGYNCPHCKMCSLLEGACSCQGRGIALTEADWRGALIKPHGSIAWKRCLNPACCSYQCIIPHEQCQPFDPCACGICSEQCGPVMVLPTMIKRLDATPEIAVMWRAAEHALADAESILLFGFSMPTSDELLVQMIRSAAHRGRRLCRVASIDIDPEGVLARFRRCIPPGPGVELVPLKVEKGVRPAWVRDLISEEAFSALASACPAA